MAIVWSALALVALAGLFYAQAPANLLLVASVLALVYFLLYAPSDCGARLRNGGRCRNNGKGLLRGCHLQQHRRQKLGMMFVPRGGFRAWWGRLNRGLWSSPKQTVDSLGAIGSLVAVPVALLQLLLQP